MKLIKFRVQSFRSIDDTDWIEINDVTAFIGTNESGKSNILMALWKLNPARDGDLYLPDDAPRKIFSQIKDISPKPVFITAVFELDKLLVDKISNMIQVDKLEISTVMVSRTLDGNYIISFPNFLQTQDISEDSLLAIFTDYNSQIDEIKNLTKSDVVFKNKIIDTISEIKNSLTGQKSISLNDFETILSEFNKIKPQNISKKSAILDIYTKVLEELQQKYKNLTRPVPNTNNQIKELIIKEIPHFIYYANYGNLDSEIYLPHVINNIGRENLRGHEAAKIRTLKVLFEFVKLNPKEILELGQENYNPQHQLTPEQVAQLSKQKTERQILLQSASTNLTQEFLNWWQQGNYKFRFNADGNHFRIWVSDEIRPEEIELEGRSTGLQWFLSFFLVFLVEQQGIHQNTILLLDEPGVSLHPIAQKDLFRFFEQLSKKNQIIYTAHSPFMVDPDHLDRVRAVYFDESGKDKGLTKVSADLRKKEKQKSEQRSVYPIHAALELAVSSVLLVGCESVIVEGISDQYYLSAIKNYLIGKGVITPEKETIFLPSGSFKGIQSLIPVISGVNESLPYVILDSDNPGKKMEAQLKSSLYTGSDKKIIMIADICKIDGAEIEDLIPLSIMKKTLSRYLRSISNSEEDIEDVLVEKTPIVNQIETFAQKYNIELPVGWKVEIAKQVKENLAKNPKSIKIESPYIEWWESLFKMMLL